MRDPVATSNELTGRRELRPAAAVIELPELGQYPQIEQPEATDALVEDLLPAAIANRPKYDWS